LSISSYKCPKGFTLIELVATLVLVGIIGAFASFFLYTGIRGFLVSKFSSETALQAQIALDRISTEIKQAEVLVNPAPTATNIGYRSIDSPLTGVRRIIYNAPSREMRLSVDGNESLLLDNVSAFSLSWTAKDLDGSGDGNNEISEIRVAFTVKSTSNDSQAEFTAQIYPRGMLAAPP
jgi:prepilin-type N-terminal cleavage/methylation domain-containing protein